MIDAEAPKVARGDALSKARFTLTSAGRFGAAIILFWLIVAIVGPFVAPFTLGEFVSDEGFAPPGGASLLGADYLGRDMFSRIVHSAWLTLGMAGAATLIATSVGSALGIFAAIKGGWTDMIISRIVDTFHSFPTLMLGLVVIAALGPSSALLILMTGLIYATSVYRIARALGWTSSSWIMCRSPARVASTQAGFCSMKSCRTRRLRSSWISAYDCRSRSSS